VLCCTLPHRVSHEFSKTLKQLRSGR